VTVLAGGAYAAGPLARQAVPGNGKAVPHPTILAIEDSRAATRADLDVLLGATRGPTRDPAIRALGRLQRRDVVPDLLPFLASEGTRGTAAMALAIGMRGAPLDGAPRGLQEQAVQAALLTAGDLDIAAQRPLSLSSISRALGRLQYQDVESFKSAETFLRRVLEKPFPMVEDEPHIGATRALESLARLNRKVGSLEEATIERLRVVARTLNPRRVDQQRNALAALIAASAVDADTLEVVIGRQDPEVRRLAMLALTGSGSSITDAERVDAIRKSFSDKSYMVRLEAVRGWTRRGVKEQGCQPLLDALGDQSLHVVLASLDALGDVCRDDESITTRLATEARTPRPQGPWQREMHAFVALTKRDRERAAMSLLAFAMHTTWQVRMYAARAAAVAEDIGILTRLAGDRDDNVAEAALPALRRLSGAESDRVFVAVLNRTTRQAAGQSIRPYEVIRTAAVALENATSTPALVSALTNALERITAEKCETSRDTRLALIERLGQLGSAAQADALMPLLKDFDPKVANAAGAVISRWTGKAIEVEIARQERGSAGIPTAQELASPEHVSIEMDNGRRFEVTFDGQQAPLARTRFLALASRGYYNNLTFHRVVPNFVIQGGSPGANEYCGDCTFMRDEVGGMHLRGTLGISTRGPDTGDAQIFINLVDNPRLDFDYTVFARVCSGMDVVDQIAEGDRIARVEVRSGPRSCAN
jgi:cyclophilin family peptidyl-prolyl cis-trans isomerase/HEAT repeat protein